MVSSLVGSESPWVGLAFVKIFVVLDGVYLLLYLPKVDVGHLSIPPVEDAGNFFECRALGLDVEEVDEQELEEIPRLGRWS